MAWDYINLKILKIKALSQQIIFGNPKVTPPYKIKSCKYLSLYKVSYDRIGLNKAFYLFLSIIFPSCLTFFYHKMFSYSITPLNFEGVLNE